MEELVRWVGLLLLAEKLRPAGGKLLVHLVDVGVALAAQVQPSELTLAEVAIVRDVPVVLLAVDDLGRPQVVPQVAVRIVHIAVHGHRVAHQGFRDVLRPAAGLGVCQLVLAVVAAGDVVIETLEVSLDVLHRDVGPVVLDKLFRGGGHGLFVRGHALGPPGLALPVVPALLELPVSALDGDVVLHLLPQQPVFLLQGGVLLENVPSLEGQPVSVAGHDGADSTEFPGRFHGKAVAQGVLEVGDQFLGREALLIAAGVGDEILHQIVVDGNLAPGVLHIRAAHVDKRPPAGVQHFTDFHHHSVAEVLGHDVKDRVADDDIVGLVQGGVIGVVRLVLGIRERLDVVHVKAVLLAPGSGPVAQAGACIQDGPVEILCLEGIVNFAVALDRAGNLCRVAGVRLVGVQGKQGRMGGLNLVEGCPRLPVVACRLHRGNGLEGEACALHAVDLGKAVRVVSGLVFQHPHTGLLQTVPQLFAAVIGDDGGQHFVEADGPLGLGLKVAGGHSRRLLVDGLDVLGRLAADFVPLLGEGPHDSVHRPLALGRFHQDAADDVALDEGIVGMSLVSLLDLRDDAADLVINGLELCFILGPLVHAQPPTVRLDLLDAAVFRRRHGLQGLGACAPGVAAALLLALLHRLDDVLQGVGIVELREAAEIAGGGVGVLAIVDARLAQQAVQLPGNPLLNGVVIHGAAQRVRGSHPVNFALGRAAVLVHIPCVVNDVLQGEDGNAVHGIVDAGLPSFVDLRVGPMPLDGHSAEHGFALFPVVVPENVADDLGILAQGVLHALAGLQVGLDFSQRVHAQAVNHLLQGVVTELVPHLVHLHRLQALALVCQIGRPHRVCGGQSLRQLCRAPGAGVVDAHRAQSGAVPEDTPGHGDIPGKPVQLVLHLGCLFAVHGVIYSRSCRRPGVAAVHLVGAE